MWNGLPSVGAMGLTARGLARPGAGPFVTGVVSPAPLPGAAGIRQSQPATATARKTAASKASQLRFVNAVLVLGRPGEVLMEQVRDRGSAADVPSH